jgi:amino acid transporter
LDALASAAYGPEAALTVLIAAGTVASRALVSIVIAVIVVLGLVFVSYLQTLEAYPNGGGSYTVAKENLGATMAAVLFVLCLSANTSFADFPRVCRLLADDGYLPPAFATRGARLVYTQGILVLTALSAFLLVAFRGITDALIPLFAVGAFSAFTLSQAGMVRHWQREGTARASMWINAAGALATASTLAVIIAAKFLEGAWMTLVIIPCGYGFFLYAQRVHRRVEAQVTPTQPIDASTICPPLAVVSLERIDRAALKAIRFAASITSTVYGVFVAADGSDPERIQHDWNALVESPIRHALLMRGGPRVVVVNTPWYVRDESLPSVPEHG